MQLFEGLNLRESEKRFDLLVPRSEVTNLSGEEPQEESMI